MKNCEPFLDTSTLDLPVRGFLHRPDTPAAASLVLTHGAGSNCEAALLVALAEAFCAAGITVLRCDLLFRQSRSSDPPPRGSAERDQAGLRAAVASIGSTTAGPILLGGHSYGGRQASMLAATDPTLASALLLLSYPLHPPNRPAELRTSHFPNLKTPALFVHGIRDGFASTPEMEAALQQIPAPTQLLSIPSAGHELLTPRNRTDLPQSVVHAFLAFSTLHETL